MKIHIGREIEKKFQESGIKIGVFAERINTGERNVYSIFKREDINADMLRSISEVLGFNFFKLYEEQISSSQVNDPCHPYSSMVKTMHINISLCAPIDGIANLPDFLVKVNELARDAGFKIS